MYKPGTRVIAISHTDEAKKVYSFGAGVYAGDFTPSDEAGGFNLGIPNPRIDLDSGKTVWGCECWWGPEEQMKKEFDGYTWVTLDIDAERQMVREMRETLKREDANE